MSDQGGETASGNDLSGKTPLATLDRLMRALVTTSGSIGTLLVLFLTLLVVTDVALRSFFARPLTGASEIGAFLVTAIVFLQAPLAGYKQRLTRLEWFGEWLQTKSSGAATVHVLLLDAASMLAFALIAKASLPGLIESWQISEFFGTQGHFTAPAWPVRLVIVVCSSLASAAFLLRIATRLTLLLRRG